MSALPVLLIPAGLIVLHGLSIPLLITGRRAIMLGNWFRHRNFMLVSGGTFSVIMALTALQLALMVMDGPATSSMADTALLVALALHIPALVVLLVMLPWTLYRVAKHLLLPHKLMARWTIRVWFYVAGSGLICAALLILSRLTG